MSSLGLPDHLLHNILVRLPSKSLCCCRCVCNSWKSIIGSEIFTEFHRTWNVTNRSHTYLFAYHHPTPQLSQYSLFSNETFEPCLVLAHPLWTEENELRIYGSSNGLLCVSDLHMGLASPISIWNPSIRKYRTLPNVVEPDNVTQIVTLSFGFQSQLDDYKVVRIMEHQIEADEEESPRCEVDVYTFSTNSWEHVNTPTWFNSIRYIQRQVPFLNGVAYWIGEDQGDSVIVRFDTVLEEFQRIMLPEIISSRGWSDLALFKDSICVVSYSLEEPDIELWIMEQQNFGQLYTISPSAGTIYEVLGFSVDDEVILGTRAENGEGSCHVALYRLGSNQVKQSVIRLAIHRCAGYYTESLVLLNE